METLETGNSVMFTKVNFLGLHMGMIELFLLISFVVNVGLLVALVLFLREKRTPTLLPERAEEVIINAEERAHAIVAEATAEARSVRNTIEKERIKALNEDQHGVDRFLDAYRFKLEKSIKEVTYGVEKEHMRATSHFVESLQSIEGRVSMNAEEAKHSMDSFTGRSSTLFERLAYEIENVEEGIRHLALALQEAAENESGKNAEIVKKEMQKIGEKTAASVVEVAQGLDKVLQKNLEKEFQSISSELETYRESRMRLVNERILILIEETTQIALQKELSLKDQADLVYRSLEEAKERGIFI